MSHCYLPFVTELLLLDEYIDLQTIFFPLEHYWSLSIVVGN